MTRLAQPPNEHPDAEHERASAASLADPNVRGSIAFLLLGVAGFISLLLGWRGVAAQLDVALQVPFLVSAGLGGSAPAADKQPPGDT